LDERAFKPLKKIILRTSMPDLMVGVRGKGQWRHIKAEEWARLRTG